MRTAIVIALLSIFLTGCADRKATVKMEALTTEEIDGIKKEIDRHMEVVLEGLETNDPDKLFRDFLRSDEVSFYLNGMAMQGYDEIVGGFSEGMESRENTRITLTSEEVVVLDRHAAMHLAEFTNEMLLANDTTIAVSGYWTAVFNKIDGQWKVVHVHESFNPLSSEEQ